MVEPVFQKARTLNFTCSASEKMIQNRMFLILCATIHGVRKISHFPLWKTNVRHSCVCFLLTRAIKKLKIVSPSLAL